MTVHESRRRLSECVVEFATKHNGMMTYAILYSPDSCYLGVMDETGAVFVDDESKTADLDHVFEARFFNAKEEFRWLNGVGEATISESDFSDDIEPIPQHYVLWGQVLGTFNSQRFVEFGSARIGAFHVPLDAKEFKHGKPFARLHTVEYLVADSETGNVYVAEERLVSIEPYG